MKNENNKAKYYSQNLNYLQKTEQSFPKGLALLLLPIYLILWIVRKIKGLFIGSVISAKEFDARVQGQVELAKKRCFESLGIDKSQVAEARPILSYTYIAKKNSDGLVTSIFKRDKDKILRSSDYEVTIVLFSANQMFVYIYQFSMIEDYYTEITREYFYSDIISVYTRHTSYTVLQGVTNTGFFARFRKAKPQSNSLTVRQNEFALITAGLIEWSTFMGSPDVWQSINAMKQLIREKKSA